MAKCWTCGTLLEQLQYKCLSCESLDQLKNLRTHVASIESHANKVRSNLGLMRGDINSRANDIMSSFEYIAGIQREGFESLRDTISDGMSEMASAIEWGFQDLCWHAEQQTDVLRSIDETLKTPTETLANEWRIQAEELRRRGLFKESEEFFLKAHDKYRLDYRIYVGLAKTYLRMDKFDLAREFFKKSLPHAPNKIKSVGNEEIQRMLWNGEILEAVKKYKKETGKSLMESKLAIDEMIGRQDGGSGFDWKSYSYRLIGHVYACEEDYDQAKLALETSIELSPAYADGHYDYAQYSAQTCDGPEHAAMPSCLSSLQKAVIAKPFYWYLAEKQHNFDSLRDEIQSLLLEIADTARRNAEETCDSAEEKIQNARRVVSGAVRATIRWGNTADSDALDLLHENARDELESAKEKVTTDDYLAFLDAKRSAGISKRIASDALTRAEEQKEKCEKIRRGRARLVFANAPYALIGWSLLVAVLCRYLLPPLMSELYWDGAPLFGPGYPTHSASTFAGATTGAGIAIYRFFKELY